MVWARPAAHSSTRAGVLLARECADYWCGRELSLISDSGSDALSDSAEKDLHFFLIWPVARDHEDEIRDFLASRFDILAEVEITWPLGQAGRNYNRLYARNLHNRWSREMSAGSGPSRMIVLQDRRPHYGLEMSASGEVGFANLNITAAKRSLRKLVRSEYRYGVHSSTTPSEFRRDVALILGVDALHLLYAAVDLDGRPVLPDLVTSDGLVGAAGWESWEELFTTLAVTDDFVVLSSSSALNSTAQMGDVDILVRSIWAFAAAANAQLELPGSSKPRFIVSVDGHERLLDLSEPGDGRMPLLWQDRLLRASPGSGARVFLADDEYIPFRIFKILFQKPEGSWASLLRELAGETRRPVLEDHEDAASFLAGFLVAEGLPLLGISPSHIGNSVGYELVDQHYRRISTQAEPSWLVF